MLFGTMQSALKTFASFKANQVFPKRPSCFLISSSDVTRLSALSRMKSDTAVTWWPLSSRADSESASPAFVVR